MSELTELENGKIFRSHISDASVTKATKVFGISRGTLSKIFTAYKRQKPHLSNPYRESKCMLSDHDRLSLKRIVIKKNMQTTL